MDFNTYYANLINASKVRRKCFLSYYSEDKMEVDAFIETYGDVFIPKAIGVSGGAEYFDSNKTDYVMGRIRETHLGDSTVTICLIGSCTHSRRYIDWEIKSSLRQGSYVPNGLLGILLPSLGTKGYLPDRFKANYNADSAKSYALFKSYPTSASELSGWIEEAFDRRTSRAHLITNSQDMMGYNGKCLVHNQTHTV